MKTPNKKAGQVIFKLEPLTKKELCTILGVSLKILNRWILAIKDQLGEHIGYRYNAKQVKLILDTYGALQQYFPNGQK